MTLLALFALIAAHYFAGSGLLHLFSIELKPVKHFSLSIICGVVLLSFIPFLLQLAFIPLSPGTLAAAIVLLCLLLNIRKLRQLRGKPFRISSFKLSSVKVYEIPFIIILAFIFFSAAWRSFYYPSNARDMLSGPEVLAHYAVKEHTIINSVFSVNLESTNNHLKPPFILGLQIIYKFFGFAVGSVWVSLISISFYIFLYQILKDRLHAVLAGTLILLFVALPEVYAYAYMMLFDYGNMALFFLGIYFMLQYFRSGKQNEVYFAAVLFGFSTFIRLETLVLIGMLLPMLWLYAYRNKVPFKRTFWQSASIVGISLLIYISWMNVFLKFYIPGLLELGSQVNPHLADLNPLFKRFSDMNSELLFGRLEEPLWAYFIKVFLIIIVLDLIITRKVSKESRSWWYALAVVYFGIPFLGYLLPLMDLTNTTKRALFKLMPVALMLMAHTGILTRLSAWLTRWELGESGADNNNAGKYVKPGGKLKAAKR